MSRNELTLMSLDDGANWDEIPLDIAWRADRQKREDPDTTGRGKRMEKDFTVVTLGATAQVSEDMRVPQVNDPVRAFLSNLTRNAGVSISINTSTLNYTDGTKTLTDTNPVFAGVRARDYLLIKEGPESWCVQVETANDDNNIVIRNVVSGSTPAVPLAITSGDTIEITAIRMENDEVTDYMDIYTALGGDQGSEMSTKCVVSEWRLESTENNELKAQWSLIASSFDEGSTNDLDPGNYDAYDKATATRIFPHDNCADWFSDAWNDKPDIPDFTFTWTSGRSPRVHCSVGRKGQNRGNQHAKLEFRAIHSKRQFRQKLREGAIIPVQFGYWIPGKGGLFVVIPRAKVLSADATEANQEVIESVVLEATPFINGDETYMAKIILLEG